MKTTVHPRLPFEDYMHLDAVNFSTLKAIDISPLHYTRALAHVRADTPAMRRGRIMHAMLLEAEPPELAVYEGKVRRGKEWDAFAEEHADKVILRRDELETVTAMRAAVLAHPIARGLLAEGQGEVTVTWSMLGHACKGRVDWKRSGGGVVEVKTTRKIEPLAFGREFGARLYHAQIAFYVGGLEAARGCPAEELPHVIAIENEPPFDVAVYRVGYEILEAGQRKIDTWIKRLDECRRRGRWPGVGEELLDLKMSEWVLTEGLDDVNLDALGG